MNRNQSDRYGNDSGYQSKRSERYRHPENDNNYRFDNYGPSSPGAYSSQSSSDNQVYGRNGNRNTANRQMNDTYSTSRNYGSMGSYGGAQGFGSSRGGYATQRRYDSDTNFNADSGRGSYTQRRESDYSPAGYRAHGYQNDYDSYGTNMGSSRGDRDLYGSGSSVSRRFQGTDQGRYNFDQNNRNMGSSNSYRDMYDSDRTGRDNFNSPNYGSSQGNYMGSGYNRTTRGSSGSNYGSSNSGSGSNSRSSDYYNKMDMNRGSGNQEISDYYRGPYGDRDINTGNDLFRHSESDYDYNPNKSFRSSRNNWNNDRF